MSAGIKALTEKHGIGIKSAALQFSLAHPATAAVIPGATRPGRIAEDAAALGGADHRPRSGATCARRAIAADGRPPSRPATPDPHRPNPLERETAMASTTASIDIPQYPRPGLAAHRRLRLAARLAPVHPHERAR